MGIPAVNGTTEESALTAACRAAGGSAALAEKINVAPRLVTDWLRAGSAHAENCVSIEDATGVRCEDLRPDLVWVRDGVGEVLGYVVPVDGADAAYVRQALQRGTEAAPAKAREVRRGGDLSEAHSFAEGGLLVCGHVGGVLSLTIDNGIDQGQVRLDPAESAMVARAILSERDRVMPTITKGRWEELADIPHALLPLVVKLEDDGLWKRVQLSSPENGQLAVFTPKGQRDHWCDLRVGDLSLPLTQQEADALAFALTGGNDGSAIAHASSLACADIAEAIHILKSESIADNRGSEVANKLAMRLNTLLDMYPYWRRRTLLAYGKVGDLASPVQHVADHLADVAFKVTDTLARLRAMIQSDNWVDGQGHPVRERGIYRELVDAVSDIRKAAFDMHKRTDKTKPTVEWRNPLVATAMIPNDASNDADPFNVRWTIGADATVDECLSEASIMVRALLDTLGGMEQPLTSLELVAAMTGSAISSAHSKLIQFAAQGKSA